MNFTSSHTYPSSLILSKNTVLIIKDVDNLLMEEIDNEEKIVSRFVNQPLYNYFRITAVRFMSNGMYSVFQALI